MLTAITSVAGALIAGCVTLHIVKKNRRRVEKVLLKAQEKVEDATFRARTAEQVVRNAAPEDVGPGGILQEFELRCELNLHSDLARRNKLRLIGEKLKKDQIKYIGFATSLGAVLAYGVSLLGYLVKGHLERGGSNLSYVGN